MSILALPGRRPETLPWMHALLADLGAPDTSAQRYGFWARPDTPDPDIAPEIEIAAGSPADLVVAKSIGTLIAMLARERGVAARRYVFIGAPVRRLAALGQTHLLAEQAQAAPTLFVQQTSDPTGAFSELAAAIGERGELREVDGDDHVYADTAGLAAIVKAWLTP